MEPFCALLLCQAAKGLLIRCQACATRISVLEPLIFSTSGLALASSEWLTDSKIFLCRFESIGMNHWLRHTTASTPLFCRDSQSSFPDLLECVLAGLFSFGPACFHAQRDTSSSRFTHSAAFARPRSGGRGPSGTASGKSFNGSYYAVPLLGECFNNVGGVHGVKL